MKRTPEWFAAHQARMKAIGQPKPRPDLENVEFIASAPNRKVGEVCNGAPSTPATPIHPLITICRSMRVPEPVAEYRFHPTRKWRADYCWPAHMLMLEVNGGVWTQGRHTRGQGAIDDMEKASEAAIMGYRILYCTPEQMHNGVALDRIVRALTDREAA